MQEGNQVNFSRIVKTPQEIHEMIAGFQNKINLEVQFTVEANLKKILSEHKNLKSFQWQQYSPYESDFEPFSRPGDFWIGETKYRLENDSNWSDVWDELRVKDEDVLKIISKAENYLQDHKDLLYRGIGNHKRVTLNIGEEALDNTITVEDYYEHQ